MEKFVSSLVHEFISWRESRPAGSKERSTFNAQHLTLKWREKRRAPPLKDAPREVVCDLRARFRMNSEVKFRSATRHKASLRAGDKSGKLHAPF